MFRDAQLGAQLDAQKDAEKKRAEEAKRLEEKKNKPLRDKTVVDIMNKKNKDLPGLADMQAFNSACELGELDGNKDKDDVKKCARRHDANLHGSIVNFGCVVHCFALRMLECVGARGQLLWQFECVGARGQIQWRGWRGDRGCGAQHRRTLCIRWARKLCCTHLCCRAGERARANARVLEPPDLHAGCDSRAFRAVVHHAIPRKFPRRRRRHWR